MKQILVTIDKKGNPTVSTSGFAGQECRKETSALESALGITTSDTLTSEAYQTPQRTAAKAGR